jgi:hypothetical protein
MQEWLTEHRNTDFVRRMDGIFQEIAAPDVSRGGGSLGRLFRSMAMRRDPEKTGELHRWMYDGLSLERLLVGLGFRDVERVGPQQSRIPNWVKLNLDSNPDGTPHQPGSVWMEASR